MTDTERLWVCLLVDPKSRKDSDRYRETLESLLVLDRKSFLKPNENLLQKKKKIRSMEKGKDHRHSLLKI